MTVTIKQRENAVVVDIEGGPTETIEPGDTFFGWSFEEMRKLQDGKQRLDSKYPTDPGIDPDD